MVSVNMDCLFCGNKSPKKSLIVAPIKQLKEMLEEYDVIQYNDILNEEIDDEFKVEVYNMYERLIGLEVLDSNFNSIDDLVFCTSCSAKFHVKYLKPEGSRIQIIKDGGEINLKTENSIMTFIPSHPHWDESIPKSIQEDFAEAETAFRYNLFNSSAVMARRILEKVVNEKGAQGNNLYEKLQNILQNNSNLLTLSHKIRTIGNFGAHDDKNVSYEDVETILFFVDHFLDAMYVIPARIDSFD